MDGVCVPCHEHTADRALHGVYSVGVAGATAAGGLTAWVAEADVDAAPSTLPMLDVSGLTVSG